LFDSSSNYDLSLSNTFELLIDDPTGNWRFRIVRPGNYEIGSIISVFISIAGDPSTFAVSECSLGSHDGNLLYQLNNNVGIGESNVFASFAFQVYNLDQTFAFHIDKAWIFPDSPFSGRIVISVS
jgi:hypothetical protein